jgi:hypothetical protein
MPGKYLKSGYDHFLPHSFQFIIYHNPIIWCYTICIIDIIK